MQFGSHHNTKMNFRVSEVNVRLATYVMWKDDLLCRFFPERFEVRIGVWVVIQKWFN